MTEATTDAERKQLEEAFFWKMFMGAMEHRGAYKRDEEHQTKSWIMGEVDSLFEKEQGRLEGGHDEEAYALAEDDGAEGWESTDSEDDDIDSLDEFWNEVRGDAQDLEEWAEGKSAGERGCAAGANSTGQSLRRMCMSYS